MYDIYLYIYNHSQFIVLYPFLQEDLTQALNNRRGRETTGETKEGESPGSQGKIRSSGRKKGRIHLSVGRGGHSVSEEVGG